jgi:hypothetical protein
MRAFSVSEWEGEFPVSNIAAEQCLLSQHLAGASLTTSLRD